MESGDFNLVRGIQKTSDLTFSVIITNKYKSHPKG